MQLAHAHAGILFSLPCALLLGELTASVTLGPAQDIYHPVVIPRVLVAGVHQPASPAQPTAPRGVDSTNLADNRTTLE
jgi:hypothetical protein